MILASRNAHKLSELARILGARPVRAAAGGRRAGPETGETFARERARQGAAAAARDRRGRDRRRLGDRARTRSAAPRGCAPRASPASTRPTRRTSRCCRACSGGQPARVRLRCRLRRSRRAGSSASSRARCEGRDGRAARAASGGFGYDPVFVPDDGRRPHDGRARRPPRRTRSATAAARCACSPAGWRSGDG